MAKINLKDGRSITVSDSFLEKSQEEQNAIVNQIVNQMGGSTTEPVGVAEDVGRGGASGLKRGTENLTGMERGTSSAIGQGLGWLGEQVGMDERHQDALQRAGEIAFLGPTAKIAEGIKMIGGPDWTHTAAPAPIDIKTLADTTSLADLNYEPATRPGKFAESVGEMLPGTLALGTGSIPARLVSGTAMGAGSELGGWATEGTALEPYARFAGAVLAPTGVSALNKLIRPGGTPPPAVAEAVDTLERQGITDLSAGQRTGNRNIQRIESEIGGGTYEDLVSRQAQQFTGAALRNAGILDDAASGQALSMNRARLGQEFDRLASTTTIPYDVNLQYQLNQLVRRYGEVTANADPAVQRLADRIAVLGAQHSGQIPGRAYQNLVTELRETAATANPDAQQALNGVREAVNEAVERGMSDPNLLSQWRATRNQWRNQLVLEDAVTRGAAENQFSGVITPARLNTSADTIEGVRRSATGQSEMANLGAAGQTVMKPLPSSETAARSVARNPVALPGMLATSYIGERFMSPGFQSYLAMQGPQAPIGGRNWLPLVTDRILNAEPSPVDTEPAPDQQGALEPLTDDPLDQRRQVAGLPLPDMLAGLVGRRMGRV